MVTELTKKYKGKVEIRVYNVNEDREAGQVATDLGVTGVPEFFFFDKDGKLVNQMPGYGGAEMLEQYVQSVQP